MSFITRARQYLRSKFETGDRPTQADFADLFESFWHKTEDRIPADNISGLAALVEQLTGGTISQDEFDALAGRVAANEGNIASHGTQLQTLIGFSGRLDAVESKATQNAARISENDGAISGLSSIVSNAIANFKVDIDSDRVILSDHEGRIDAIEADLLGGVGAVQTVNGIGPDANGNVVIPVGDEPGQNIEFAIPETGDSNGVFWNGQTDSFGIMVRNVDPANDKKQMRIGMSNDTTDSVAIVSTVADNGAGVPGERELAVFDYDGVRLDGNVKIKAENGRYFGFENFSGGMEVDFRFGDSENRISNAYNGPMRFTAYHGVEIINKQYGSAGPGLKVTSRVGPADLPGKDIVELFAESKKVGVVQYNGNMILQDGGTFTDTGERLQIAGTIKADAAKVAALIGTGERFVTTTADGVLGSKTITVRDIDFGLIRDVAGSVFPDIDFNIFLTKAISTVGTNAVFGPGVVALKNAKRAFPVRFVLDSKNAGDTLTGFLAATGAVSVTFDGGASTSVIVDQVGYTFTPGVRNDIEILMIDDARFEVFINPKF